MTRRNKKIVVSLLILTAALYLIFVRSSVFAPLKFQVVNVLSLPIRIVTFPFKEMKKLILYHKTHNDYMRLRKEYQVLHARLIGTEETMRENQRLARLLDFKRKVVYSATAASVIGRDPSNWSATLIIDKGKDDGVDVGMPVVNAAGVVGKIAETGDHRSKVILLTDPSFSVVALSEHSREVGLVSGTLQGLCRMRYLSPEAGVTVGDQVVTSKLSASFPEGLLVGEVVSVDLSPDNTMLDCLVKPAVTASQVEEVLVILKQ
ncbi:MAG: rod shape-determining protein MreC [Candidatus Omnitrophota bacterium]|nr:rod shape-determining protein MreC [Candidatus Omnitrophota bacterium]MDZ4242128.1 rod shape-determining protein MreC [Candidatus Omnitrophota bacterium]